MDLASAAHTINATAYSYISSWALLTAADQRLFDRLPARSNDLVDISPDGDLVDTILHTLAAAGLVETDGEQWVMSDEMTMLLTGEDSYADYLFSSIPGGEHERLIEALAARGIRWIAIHDFMVGTGRRSLVGTERAARSRSSSASTNWALQIVSSWR